MSRLSLFDAMKAAGIDPETAPMRHAVVPPIRKDNLMSDAVMPRAEQAEFETRLEYHNDWIKRAGQIGGAGWEDGKCPLIVSSLLHMAQDAIRALAASTPVGGWEEPDEQDVLDTISDAIGDSMDLDWTYSIGAKAIVEAFKREGWTLSAPPPPSVSIDNGSSPDGDTHRVPDGWVLVPKEPTTAMLQGACDKHTPGQPMSKDRPCECPRFETRRRVWERMVAGSQATPQPADGCSSNEGAA